MVGARIFLVAMLISVATVGGGFAMPQSQEESGQNWNHTRSTYPQTEKTNDGGDAAIQNQERREDGSQKEKQSDTQSYKKSGFLRSAFRAIDRSERVINVFSTLALAVFTALLFIATLILASSTEDLRNYAEEQTRDMKRSIAEAKRAADVANQTLIASQRAWIRTEVNISDQPLIFGDNGAGTSVSFKITNVGNTPAINISHHARLLVIKNGGPSPFDEQRKRCGEVRKQPFRPGFTLFPGEIFPSSIGFGTLSLGVNVSKDDVDKGREISADGKHVLMWVIGCVDYTFPTDPTTHHQTMFMFELTRSRSLIAPDDGTIPASELRLQESGIGDGRYAD